MNCSSIMKREIECVRRDEAVESAAERMKIHNVGFLPVCDDAGAVVGTITDRDLAIRVLGEHRNAAETLVMDVMSLEVLSCSPEDDLTSAEDLMAVYKKSRILCTDQQGRPVGVISLSDIAQVEQASRTSDLLRSVASREARGLRSESP